MLLRPRLTDFKVIGFYTGKIIVGVGLLLFIPLIVALINQEWNTALDFIIGSAMCFIIGSIFQIICYTTRDPTWLHGMVTVSFSWLLAMMLGAIPHYLSGHFSSYLDACFDLMSGYTTTGLYLLQDLDHIANGLNMWRHLLTYAGGQGLIVIALTFLITRTGGAVKMYVGEGKEEKLLPNVVQTARAIWLISLIYLFVGSLFLWIANLVEGMSVDRGLFHAIWLFMGAWSTGGFAPQSQNLLYYHSLIVEIITMVLFVIGSFNFAVHWAVLTGNKREIYRNIETISFFITSLLLFTIVITALIKLNVYPDLISTFRKGIYLLLSGHTATGNTTIYSRTFVREWGPLAMIAVIIAMAIGGSACSTAGGLKGLRLGIILKGLLQDVKKLILPESAVVVQKYHHINDIVLEHRHVRNALLIVISFVLMHLIGAVLGTFYGYSFIESLFDSVSAGSTTGLSCGVTSTTMPTTLKVYYIFAMWAGRLEFLSIFALSGFIVSIVRGR